MIIAFIFFLYFPLEGGSRLAKRAGWGSADKNSDPTPPTVASLRRHSRCFASALFLPRTAADGRLCLPFQGREKK
jgi:hypothetical protein